MIKIVYVKHDKSFIYSYYYRQNISGLLHELEFIQKKIVSTRIVIIRRSFSYISKGKCLKLNMHF